MIKPDATAAGNTGKIIDKIIESGFSIRAMKLTQLTKEDASRFYEVHKERPFYGELVEYMTSGPIVAAILEKDNAVESFRTLIGATDPSKQTRELSVACLLQASLLMPFTVQIATRMQPSKVHSSSLSASKFKFLIKN